MTAPGSDPPADPARDRRQHRPRRGPTPERAGRPLLALDTGSPLTSVAVGFAGEVAARREAMTRASSAELLRWIHDVLGEAGLAARDLGGIVALRGPGSFTGLRVGLATALGLHQALAVPATGISTLPVLAAAAGTAPGPLFAAVDALRGEWFGQLFEPGDPPVPAAAPALLGIDAISRLEAATVVGFGVEELSAQLHGPRALVPGALAPAALRLAARRPRPWNAALLTSPVYSRPAAARPPAAGLMPTMP